MKFFHRHPREPLPPNVVRITDLMDRKAKKQKEREWNLVERHNMDYFFFILMIILLAFGVVMITSASGYVSYNDFDNSMYYLIRQLIMIALGMVAFVILSFIPLRLARFASWWMYILGVLLSLYVVFWGKSVNGSQRWINLGVFSFQPSEFMKIALALVLAYEINRLRERINDGRVFVWLSLIILLPAVITVFSNLSTTLIMVGIGLIMMIIGGVPLKYMGSWVLLGIIVVILVLLPLLPFYEDIPSGIRSLINRFAYRAGRIKPWIDPFNPEYMSDDSYQIVQSLYAIVHGGWFGVGYGAGTQKLGNIPEAHNDIIFAVICEEFGFVGALIVVMLFFLLIYEGMRIAQKAPNIYLKLLVVGLMSEIALQVSINVAVTANLIPATGIALPFISYGGSAVIMMMGAMGLVLNVSAHIPQKMKDAGETAEFERAEEDQE